MFLKFFPVLNFSSFKTSQSYSKCNTFRQKRNFSTEYHLQTGFFRQDKTSQYQNYDNVTCCSQRIYSEATKFGLSGEYFYKCLLNILCAVGICVYSHTYDKHLYMHTYVAHSYIDTLTFTLKGETLANTKFRDFRKFWVNLLKFNTRKIFS